MAVNLRLSSDAAHALRVEAERAGVSQQVLLRRAVDAYLGLGGATDSSLPDWVEPPARPFRTVPAMIPPTSGQTLGEALQELREDRIA